MPTKKDLEQQVKSLQNKLLEAESEKGTNIHDCHIDMSSPDETRIAIAKAVEEGMKALQKMGGDTYGIYIDGTRPSCSITDD